jgi:hypothetical protein
MKRGLIVISRMAPRLSRGIAFSEQIAAAPRPRRTKGASVFRGQGLTVAPRLMREIQ